MDEKKPQFACGMVQRFSFVLFPMVFGFSLGDSLPLHIVGSIGTAVLERLYMVDHIAGAATCGAMGGWTGMFMTKFNFSVIAAHDPPMLVAQAGQAAFG